MCVCVCLQYYIPLWYVCVPVIGTMYRDAICMKIGAEGRGKENISSLFNEQYNSLLVCNMFQFCSMLHLLI